MFLRNFDNFILLDFILDHESQTLTNHTGETVEICFLADASSFSHDFAFKFFEYFYPETQGHDQMYIISYDLDDEKDPYYPILHEYYFFEEKNLFRILIHTSIIPYLYHSSFIYNNKKYKFKLSDNILPYINNTLTGVIYLRGLVFDNNTKTFKQSPHPEFYSIKTVNQRIGDKFFDFIQKSSHEEYIENTKSPSLQFFMPEVEFLVRPDIKIPTYLFIHDGNLVLKFFTKSFSKEDFPPIKEIEIHPNDPSKKLIYRRDKFDII